MAGKTKGRYLFHLIEGLPQFLWNRISAPMVDADWRLTTKQDQSLKALVDSAMYQSIARKPTYIDQTRQLRVEMSRLLTSPSTPRKGELCQWIVRNWGRIWRRGAAEVAFWPDELRCFEPENIREFIKKRNGKDRISSWSKVLGFALPDEYAIYDSRNALALNVLLEDTSVPNRFFMPGGQGDDPPPAVTHVMDKLKTKYANKNIKWAGYDEYNDLLDAMAAVAGTDLLDVEMHLFSHSIGIAQSFVNRAATAAAAVQPPAPQVQAQPRSSAPATAQIPAPSPPPKVV